MLGYKDTEVRKASLISSLILLQSRELDQMSRLALTDQASVHETGQVSAIGDPW